MDIDALRRLCLSFPGTTEQIQWGDSLLFKVRGKMFAVTRLEPSDVWISFKVTPDNFVELTERAGIIPAPYLARANWVAIESPTILPTPELASLLRESYELILAKLPQKIRESLTNRVRAKKRRTPLRAAKKMKGD
ncbi:MAG: MmcQ/YjbR family DNA-binding protein [Candidatus Acidiferrum sp.]